MRFKRECDKLGCKNVFTPTSKFSTICTSCCNNKFRGYETCPDWLKKVYRKSAEYICQLCNKDEAEAGKLIPHRITRGYKGGLYTVHQFNHKSNNVKIVCNTCHKEMHANEFK